MLTSCKRPAKELRQCKVKAFGIPSWRLCYVKSVTLERCHSIQKRGKLNPLYIGPFKILKRVSPVGYTLELLEELSNVHSTFHVSNLKKCPSDESLIIPMKELWLDDKLNFMEEPIEIIDREVKQLRQSRIPIVKSKLNGKLIVNSIKNGPYVRRMIHEPGDPNGAPPVAESIHEQADEELIEKEAKQMEADDQAIQTSLMGLREYIYVVVDSCDSAKEILLRVEQMMRGSSIGAQEKKTKLFNEWEKFNST
ncbi:hypothetical protein Tco_1311704 [Tanacetum coccineum]